MRVAFRSFDAEATHPIPTIGNIESVTAVSRMCESIVSVAHGATATLLQLPVTFVVLNLVCGGRRLIDGGLEAIDRLLLLDAFRQLLSTFLNECLHVVDGS